MEAIPNDVILEFNPNCLHEVRKELNLHDPGAMAGVVDNFQEWISKQSHFIKKDFSREYLERSVIMAKGSLERAKSSLEKLCTVKTLLPEYFRVHDVKELPEYSNFMVQAMLPKTSKDNYRVSLVKILSTDFDGELFRDFYNYTVLVTEYLKAHDYILGFNSFVDLRDVNIVNLAMKINIVELKHIMYIMMEGYGFRVKGIHLLSNSKTVETLVNLLKQVVSAKIGSRIHVHRSLETVYEHMPREILPKDLGGDERPMQTLYEAWRNVLGAKENVEYFKEICKPGTNEAYRQTAKFNDQVLGMPGSFRTLKVD